MIETVQTLATKYGRDKGQELNEVGTISSPEAKEALRLHRGNVWAAVTECVDQRRKKVGESIGSSQNVFTLSCLFLAFEKWFVLHLFMYLSS